MNISGFIKLVNTEVVHWLGNARGGTGRGRQFSLGF